jgi:hypothetical protein
VRHTTKVDNTLDRVIQANTALDLSVSDLKQSMELVATRLATVEKARTTLSTPGTAELDPGLIFPISTVTTRNGGRKVVRNISNYTASNSVCGLLLPPCISKGMQHYGCRPMRHYIALLHGQSCV